MLSCLRPRFAGVSPFLNHVACQEAHSCYGIGNEHGYEGPPGVAVLGTIVEPTSFRWHSTMSRSKFRMSTMKTLLPEDEPQRLEALRRKIAELEQSQRMLSEQLRQANKALGQSEERFRDLFDAAPIDSPVRSKISLAASNWLTVAHCSLTKSPSWMPVFRRNYCMSCRTAYSLELATTRKSNWMLALSARRIAIWSTKSRTVVFEPTYCIESM